MEWYRIVLFNYMGNGAFIGLSLICLAIIMYEKKYRKEIGWPSIFIIFFLVNPFVISFLVENMLEVNRVTKLLIVFPAHILIALVLTEKCDNAKKWFVAIILIMVFGRDVYLDGDFKLLENEYKLPQEVIEVCNAIREIQGNDEEVVVLAAEPLNNYMRLYDENIMLEAGRYRAGLNSFSAMLEATIQAEKIDEKFLGEYAQKADIDYIVVAKYKVINKEIMLQYGYECTNVVSGYQIIKKGDK